MMPSPRKRDRGRYARDTIRKCLKTKDKDTREAFDYNPNKNYKVWAETGVLSVKCPHCRAKRCGNRKVLDFVA